MKIKTKSKTKEINLGYIHIASFRPGKTEEFEDLDAKELVLPANKVFILKIDYPVTNQYSKSFTTSKTGINRTQLVNLICRNYRLMYQQEDKDMGKPTKNIPNMFNRDTSEGRYGIWGHDIGDLILHTAYINKSVITLGVDS